MAENSALALMQELGPLLDPAQIIHYEERSAWMIGIDEATLIDVIYDNHTNSLVFQLDLGPLQEERQAVLHELLLRFSYIWTQNGGTYMALDDEGRAALMYRTPLSDLDVTRLQTLIGNLLDQSLRWRELIAKEPDEASGEGMSQDDMLPTGGIRV